MKAQKDSMENQLNEIKHGAASESGEEGLSKKRRRHEQTSDVRIHGQENEDAFFQRGQGGTKNKIQHFLDMRHIWMKWAFLS